MTPTDERRTPAVRHLPFALAVGAITVVATIVSPSTLADPVFSVGLAVALVAVLLTVTAPWDRLRPGWEIVVPALDYVVVLLCREGSRNELDAVGILVVFPALWLSNAYRWRGSAVAAAATLLVFLGPYAFNPDLPLGSRDWARIILFPVIVLLLGIHGNIQSRLVEAKKRRLEQLTGQLTAALDKSDERKLLLDSVLNTVDVAVIVVDEDGREVLTNRVAQSIDRTANRADQPSNGPERIATFHEDRVTPYSREDRLALRGARQDVVTGELLWIGIYPEQTAWLATVRPVTRDDGSFFRSVIALHEVTDLVSAVAVKQDFVDSISHELRTPLTSIVGYLDLIRDEVPPGQEQLLGMLDIVDRNAGRVSALVDDLVSAGKQGLSVVRSNVDVATLVHGCIDAARPTAAAAGVELVGRLEAATASVDPTRIGQAVDNLLSNAVKYSAPGTRVRVSVDADSDSDVIRICVSDQGAGIAPADTARIFDRFYRTPDAADGSAPGLGLGLAITSSIVRAHDGRIDVDSEIGHGTSMTMILPRSHRIG